MSSESCLPFEFTQLIGTDTVAGLAGVAGRAQLMSHLLNSAATSARSPRRATLRTDAAPECFAKHTDQITAMVQQPRAISASARARRSVSRARVSDDRTHPGRRAVCTARTGLLESPMPETARGIRLLMMPVMSQSSSSDALPDGRVSLRAGNHRWRDGSLRRR